MSLERSLGKNWELLESVYPGEENVIIIKNPKTEKLIEEILKRSRYSSPQEYLEARIQSDFEVVIKNKKLL